MSLLSIIILLFYNVTEPNMDGFVKTPVLSLKIYSAEILAIYLSVSLQYTVMLSMITAKLGILIIFVLNWSILSMYKLNLIFTF